MKIRKGIQKNIQKIKEVAVILFWENKITASLIGTSLLMNAVVWLGLFILVKKGQSVLIGHYNVFFGIDVLINLADKNSLGQLFLPPIGGIFFLLMSVIMSIFFILQLDRVTIEEEIKEAFVSNKSLSFMGSRLLLIGAWLVQLILIVYLISIWFINR
jgi:hypothetical protein